MSSVEKLKPVSKSFQAISNREPEVEISLPMEIKGEILYRRMSFARKDLHCIELSDEFSLLMLRNGIQVAVKLPYEVLRKKLDSNAALIDLKEATGAASEGAPKARLLPDQDSLTNLERKPAENEVSEKGVEIHAFIVQPGQGLNQTRPFTFYSEEMELGAKLRGLNSGWSYVALKGRNPFKGVKGFCMHISQGEFTERLNLAQMKGLGTLDLRDQTRNKTRGLKRVN